MTAAQRIFGIDFTSVPSKRKPIVCCELALDWPTSGHPVPQLSLIALTTWETFDPFETFLATLPKGSMTGIDCPLGLPLAFLAAQGWDTLSWREYLAKVSAHTKASWLALVNADRATRPPGQKLPLRETDRLAQAKSPLMTVRVPLANMLYEGATRVAQAHVSVWPFDFEAPEALTLTSTSQPIVAEVYPAQCARYLQRRLHQHKSPRAWRPYKQEKPTTAEALQDVQQAMLHMLLAPETQADLGITLNIPHPERLLGEAKGDMLDAFFAAIWTALAYLRPSCMKDSLATWRQEGWLLQPWEKLLG